MEINGERWWTLKELAAELRISQGFLRTFIHPRGIPCYRQLGRRGYLFKLNEAWDFLIKRVRRELPPECLPPRAASAKLRRQVLERDGHHCRYCGIRVEGRQAQTDHVLAFKRGGLTTLDNLVTACIPCNRRKRDHTPEEAGMALLPIPE